MIPPRPWRAVPYLDGQVALIEDAEGSYTLMEGGGQDSDRWNRATVELVVRLVNAEPEIVAALEAAERYLVSALADGWQHDEEQALIHVRAALAKARP